MVLECEDASLVHGAGLEAPSIADAGAGEDAVGEGAEHGLGGVHGGQAGVR